MKNILSKQLLRNEVLHLVLLLMAALAVGYVLYNSQHQKVLELTNQNAKLSTDSKTQAGKISELQSTTTDLTKKNVILQNEVDQYRKASSLKVPQPKYSLHVNSVKQYSPPAYIPQDDTTYTLLVIDVSVTNAGDAEGYVSPTDFTVKDTNNVSQQTMSEWFGSARNVYLPPPQPVALNGQIISEGDTARGSLVFYVLASQTDFVVNYNGESFPVAVDGKIVL